MRTGRGEGRKPACSHRGAPIRRVKDPTPATRAATGCASVPNGGAPQTKSERPPEPEGSNDLSMHLYARGRFAVKPRNQRFLVVLRAGGPSTVAYTPRAAPGWEQRRCPGRPGPPSFR